MKEFGAVVSTKSNEEKLNARFETHGVNAPLAATSRAVIHMCGRQENKRKHSIKPHATCLLSSPNHIWLHARTSEIQLSKTCEQRKRPCKLEQHVGSHILIAKVERGDAGVCRQLHRQLPQFIARNFPRVASASAQVYGIWKHAAL